MDCVFCNIVAHKAPADIILETPKTIVIQDLYPKSRIHWLVIPKQHIVNMKDFPAEQSDLAREMFLAVQLSYQKACEEIGSDVDFKIVCNNGPLADQVVFHLHWHLVAK